MERIEIRSAGMDMTRVALVIAYVGTAIGCWSAPRVERSRPTDAADDLDGSPPERGRKVAVPPSGCRAPTVRAMAEPRFVKPVGERLGDETHVFVAGGRLVVFQHPHGKPVAGEIYNPVSDRWTDVPSSNAPRFGSFKEGPGPLGSPRFFAFEDWIIVTWFDGNRSPRFQGAVFDAHANRWQSMSTAGMPDKLDQAIEVGTAGVYVRLGSSADRGDAYDIRANRWRPIARTGAASARTGAMVAAAAGKVVVVGGLNVSAQQGGAIYHVGDDRWSPLTTNGGPTARFAGYVASADRRVVVWSGSATSGTAPHLTDGGVYSLDTAQWSPIAAQSAPDPSLGGVFDQDLAWTGEALVYRELPGNDRGAPRRLAFFDPSLGQWWRSSTQSHVRPWILAHGRVLLPDPAGPRLYHPRAKLECSVTLPALALFANLEEGTSFAAHARIGDELVVWGRVDTAALTPSCPAGAPCVPHQSALVTSSHGVVITP
jgi:hypothetical protein